MLTMEEGVDLFQPAVAALAVEIVDCITKGVLSRQQPSTPADEGNQENSAEDDAGDGDAPGTTGLLAEAFIAWSRAADEHTPNNERPQWAGGADDAPENAEHEQHNAGTSQARSVCVCRCSH